MCWRRIRMVPARSPDRPSKDVISLRDEAAFIGPVLRRTGSPRAPVGHSCGAAVAPVAALPDPGRVRAIADYEPTLFCLLDANSPPQNDAFLELHVPMLLMVGRESTASARASRGCWRRPCRGWSRWRSWAWATWGRSRTPMS
jgi:alpha-beta hydrolase superfamily lysophospholipase